MRVPIAGGVEKMLSFTSMANSAGSSGKPC